MIRVEELREQIANEQSAEVAQQTVLWRLGVAIHRIERRDELVSLLESELASAKADLARAEVERDGLRASMSALSGFHHALGIVESGFNDWKAKLVNAKWFKRIDGTPIPNDLCVVIAVAVAAAARRALGQE